MSVQVRMRFVSRRLLWMSLLAAAAGAGYLFAADDAVRVSEADLRKAAIAKPKPDYPPMARQLHISGRGEVDVFVDSEGSVEKVEPKSGNPMFTSAMVSTLKKWKFTPFKADGKPVSAVGTLRIEFSAQ